MLHPEEEEQLHVLIRAEAILRASAAAARAKGRNYKAYKLDGKAIELGDRIDALVKKAKQS